MPIVVEPTKLAAVLNLEHATGTVAASIEACATAAAELVAEYVDLEGAAGVPLPVTFAAEAIAVELWNARLSPAGYAEGADFAPVNRTLGRSLIGRFSGLLGPWLDVDGMVG